VTVAVAGHTLRPAILDIRRQAAAVARASQRRLKLALNHRLDELTYPLTQPDFDRVSASDCRAGDVVLLLVMA
jgi:hypothetical protein